MGRTAVVGSWLVAGLLPPLRTPEARELPIVALFTAITAAGLVVAAWSARTYRAG